MLILHRSARADVLVAALGRLLREPLQDPIEAEVVSVPTRGVERWIAQRLSHVLGGAPAASGGVCANLRFPFPASLIGRTTAIATGIEPASDPWAPERMVWPLIEVIDTHPEDATLAPLFRHLRAATPPGPVGGGGDSGPLRRYATASHVAELFDRYSAYRPDIIRAWAAGGDEGAGGGAAWQPHLWRLVRDRVRQPSPAERLEAAIGTIRSDPGVLDLPSRLSVFGLTRLPAADLAVLDAIAVHRDVHLFLLHPSEVLWERIAGLGPGRPLPPERSADVTARLVRHPLLRSWGRDAREMQIVLSSTSAQDSPGDLVAEPSESGPDAIAMTLLARIQSDIRADSTPGEGGDRPALHPDDRSIQIHSCHGRMRQVEVLRDAVLHLMQDDPTLEARDVIVMCPDVDVYAPLIEAAFVASSPVAVSGESPILQVRLADRSLRQTNPLLAVAADLLDLAASRVSAPAVVDLMARPPVSRRFGFDQEDLATIERWVAGTSVRWGLDAEHRRPWALSAIGANTWASGLDRLMLGVAMAEDDCRTFEDVVPYDQMTGTQVDLAGRLTELIARLSRAVDTLSGRRPLATWLESIVSCTELLACSEPDESWQHEEMRSSLAEIGSALDGGGDGPELGLDEATALLRAHLRGRPTRANFRTGDVTVCTLVPMRSVPHRVVALLGLDDGSFPRQPDADGDDVMLDAPRVGDREPRSEDRQLLLDALMAATEHLVITFSGRDERTNRHRPPCPPVAELLDVIDATATGTDGGRARHGVVFAHPLQSFDPRNFSPGTLRRDGPWSFDGVLLDGARAASSPVVDFPAPDRLPPLEEPVIQLEHLVGFLQHPVRAFLRRRFSLYLGDWSEDLGDRLPLELGALERWSVGDRLLESVLGGVDLSRAVTAERHRGALPPGPLSSQVLDGVADGVAALAAAMTDRGFGPGPSEAVQIRVELLDGRSVTGTVPQVRDSTVLQCTYSRLGPKHRLAAWVRFLALSAERSDQEVTALSVGKSARPGGVAASLFGSLPGSAESRRQTARMALSVIADLYDRGMREALPMACATTAAWCEARHASVGEDQLLERASRPWLPSGDIPGERDQAEHQFVYGRSCDIRVLLDQVPGPDEDGPGWATHDTRFGRLAHRLWDPVLWHESLSEA